MTFAYAWLKSERGKWLAVPGGQDIGWIVDNPLDIPDRTPGAVVMVRYIPEDQFCRVVTPSDVGDAFQRAESAERPMELFPRVARMGMSRRAPPYKVEER